MDRKIKNSLFNTWNSTVLECSYVSKVFKAFVEIADQNTPNYGWTSAINKGLCCNSISQFLGFIAFRQAQFIPITMLEKIHFSNSYTNREASMHCPKMLCLTKKKKKKSLWVFKVLYGAPLGIAYEKFQSISIYKLWNPISVNIFSNLKFK